MRILVTNDDGIDAPGIIHLAEAMVGLGEIVVIAPDQEYSGASAAIGAIWLEHPTVRRRHDFPVDGVSAAWAVGGPPALCVMYARLGAFGDPFDLVVSGINPGANVGRSVYHSGTIGACLSGRNGGWSGVAISQATADWGVEGQGLKEALALQKWETAATVARSFVKGLITALPTEPVVANINVPNVDVEHLQGWSLTQVGQLPPRAMTEVELLPREGEPDTFDVKMTSGEKVDLPIGTDGGMIEANGVSVTYLSRLETTVRADMGAPESALDALLG